MTKRLVAFVFLLTLVQASSLANAQGRKAQAGTERNKDLFSYQAGDNRKVESAVLLKAIVAFTLRIKQRYPDQQKAQAQMEERNLEIGMGTADFILSCNAFWQADTLQPNVIEKYLARIPTVPLAFEDEWSDTLERVSRPTVGLFLKRQSTGRLLEMPVLLGTIIAQDQLFDSRGFNETEAKRLLGRLASVSEEAVDQWATARLLRRQYAAITLINLDAVFTKDVFQKELFARKLRESTVK